MQFEAARQKAELKEKLTNLKFMLSEASLQLLPEYRQRMEASAGFQYSVLLLWILGDEGSRPKTLHNSWNVMNWGSYV